MNIARICNPEAEEPFHSFCDRTTTYVRLPECNDCQLYLEVDEPGQLVIEADGAELYSCPIDPNMRLVPLTPVLNPVMRRGARSVLSVFTHSFAERQPIRDFKVVVKHTEQPSPSVAATFNFRLLTPAEYDRVYADHVAECGQPLHHHSLVVDWQPDEEKRCWNCKEVLPEDSLRQCKQCGADQEQAGEQQ